MAPFLVIVVTLCRLTGTHGITTVSEEVSVEVGATVSIPCLYKPSHKNLVKYLCKGGVWLSCDKIITTNSKSSFPEGQYTISDDPDQGVFTVSIISQEEGTQTYWCAVEMGFSKLDEKTQFKLFVSKATSTTVSTLSDEVSTKKITEKEPDVLRNDLKNQLLPLGILLFIIAVALLVSWMFHRRAKRKLTAITVSSETDVVYSSVMPVHSTAAQNKPTGDMNLKKNPKEDENITYSVIGPHPRI
ncbi:trem-like transcript 4 protein isoform X2 [Gadus morhua]|uniref:trem-like transcript 4 protein isoform X2 n=1 Tax=Gadus morhua TaxID=8049 RepID=UPI0011B46FE2|nr:trem-like transcript 4 protein isoform X2 [Gadus morhua]